MAGGSRFVALVFVSAFAAGFPAQAQRVRGTLRDSTSGAPVPGAVVWVSDNANNFLARSAGDSAGHYAVPRLVGAARLHVRRIGYRPSDVDLPLAPGDSMLDLRLAALPLALDPVLASRRRVCPGDKGTSEALDLWEGARSALLSAVVAREAAAPRVKLLSYTQRIGAAIGAAARLAVKKRDLVADRSYVAARTAYDFASKGYMREAPGGERIFFAPDEEVLLDPSFADTHCLRVVPGTGAHAADVGIGFEPVRGRDTLVDVAGTLWISRRLPQLRELEFHYTDLERVARESGGDITFGLTPNGAPMIERWVIHAAVLRVDEPLRPSPIRHRIPERPDRTDVSLVGYMDTGGVLAWAEWPDGKVWHSTLPTVNGTVFTAAGARIVGASVWIDELPDTVTTDSLGQFTLHDVLPGIHVVNAGEPRLAAVGVSFARTFAQIKDTAETRVTLYINPLAYVLGLRCGEQERRPQDKVLLGRIVDADGEVVRGRVLAAFTPRGESNAKTSERTVETDAEGRFAICNGPPDQRVHLRAVTDAGEAEADIDSKANLLAVTLIVRPRNGG